MTDSLPVPRFPLPDEWEPEGTRCLRVIIPDDDQYQAIIVGLIDHLKWSTAYARDDTKTGAATVARTWKQALLVEPIKQGCEMVMLRQNPDNDCETQYSNDDGETWIGIRVPDCPLPVPELPHELDACYAASSVIVFFTDYVEKIQDGLEDGDSYTTIASDVGNWALGYFGVPIINSMITRLLAAELDTYSTAGQNQFNQSFETYCDYFDHFVEVLNTDGTLIDNWYITFHTWLVEQDNEVFRLLTQQVINAEEMNNFALLANYNTDECFDFGDGFTWFHAMDFRDGSSYGFEAPAPQSNSLVATEGWLSNAYVEFSVVKYGMRIVENDIRTFHLHSIQVLYTQDTAEGGTGISHVFTLRDLIDAEDLITDIVGDAVEGTFTHNVSPTADSEYIKEMQIKWLQYSSDYDDQETSGILHKLTIRGRGFNPYL